MVNLPYSVLKIHHFFYRKCAQSSLMPGSIAIFANAGFPKPLGGD